VGYLSSVLDRCSREGDVSREATWALAEIGSERACEVLVRALSREEIRHHVAVALGQVSDSAAVPALLEALRHETEESVREALARALAAIGSPEAIRGLAGLLSAHDVGLRSDAASALGKTGSALAVSALDEALRIREHLENERFAAALVSALSDLGCDRTSGSLEFVVNDCPFRHVRESARAAIRRCKGEQPHG
jgi:HEAT repeat protein